MYRDALKLTSPWPLEAQYSMSGMSTSLMLLQGRGGPTCHNNLVYTCTERSLTWSGAGSPGTVRLTGPTHSVRPYLFRPRIRIISVSS